MNPFLRRLRSGTIPATNFLPWLNIRQMPEGGRVFVNEREVPGALFDMGPNTLPVYRVPVTERITELHILAGGIERDLVDASFLSQAGDSFSVAWPDLAVTRTLLRVMGPHSSAYVNGAELSPRYSTDVASAVDYAIEPGPQHVIVRGVDGTERAFDVNVPRGSRVTVTPIIPRVVPTVSVTEPMDDAPPVRPQPNPFVPRPYVPEPTPSPPPAPEPPAPRQPNDVPADPPPAKRGSIVPYVLAAGAVIALIMVFAKDEPRENPSRRRKRRP